MVYMNYLNTFIIYGYGEGPFNIWSLTQWGKNAVGLLGTGTELQLKQLVQMETKNYILALDPDTAGRNGTKKIIDFLLKNHKQDIWVADLPDGKDINDLTQEQFKKVNVLPYYIWCGKYFKNS